MHDAATLSSQPADALLTLSVETMRAEAEGVMELRLSSADGSVLPPWSPGAHIDLILPNGMTRQYSLCGAPSERANWRIGVLHAPSSRGGSEFVHKHLKPGSHVQASLPRNHFPLVQAKRYLFIAGGIGITPILPMLARLSAANAEWTLLYGGRSRRSMAFLKEIEQLSGGTVIVRPEDQYGLLDLGRHLARHEADRTVYCCGPEPLIAVVEEHCRDWPAGSLHRERFAPSELRTPLDPDEFEVELARSGRRVRVSADQSMLKALEEAGCSITNSCRAGICGTCLVKVLAGIPEHNDYILSDQQRAAGDVVLPCVSRSKTETLVLDL